MRNKAAVTLISIILVCFLLFETFYPAGFLYPYFAEQEQPSTHRKRRVPPIAPPWYAGNFYEGSFISDQPDNPLQSKLWSRNNVNLKDKGSITTAPSFKWKTDLGSPYAYSTTQPIIADIDQDGKMDIALTGCTNVGAGSHSFLFCFDAETGEEKWRSAEIAYLNSMRVTGFDIDTDGYIEILVGVSTAGATQGLWCFNHDGTVRWHKNIDRMRSVACFDIDGDTQIELVVSGQDTLYCFDYQGEIEWNKTISAPRHIMIGDVNNDGNPEIVTHSYLATSPNYIHILNSEGDTIKTIEIPVVAVVPLCIYDVNNDGNMEILYYSYMSATTDNIGLVDIEGNIVGTYSTGYMLAYIHQAAVYDVNGDGYAEIFISGKYTAPGEILALTHEGERLWNYTTTWQSESGVVLADINSDGKLEAIFIERNGEIRCFNASTGDVLWEFDNVGIIFNNIAVADVDNDGLAEIIYCGGYPYEVNWFRIAVLE